MSNILVTGGLGFIGSNFISKIIDKENFIVNVDSETYASLDKSYLNFESNKNYRHYNIDITDYQKLNEIIKKYSFDIKIIHTIVNTGIATDCIPVANPDIKTVADPVSPSLAIFSTGLPPV